MAARPASARERNARGFRVLVAAGLIASYLAGASVAVAASGGPRKALAGWFSDAPAEASP